jgi:rhodanese-related sulfurtransferase
MASRKYRGVTPDKSFSLERVLKETLLIVVAAVLLGGVVNHSMVMASIKGELIPLIQQQQLTALKTKAQQISSEIQFVDLISAKKLFDERQAKFLDARDPDIYARGHIVGALELPITSVVRGDISLDQILPDKEAILVTYCDGGECDISVELAKELLDHGYSNVFVLGEGYPGWEASGYPVETSGVEK